MVGGVGVDVSPYICRDGSSTMWWNVDKWWRSSGDGVGDDVGIVGGVGVDVSPYNRQWICYVLV